MGTIEVILLSAAIIFICVVIIVLIRQEIKYNHEYRPDNVKDITYDTNTGMLSFRHGRKNELYRSYGNGGTVWYNVSGMRENLRTEGILTNIYQYWKRLERRKELEMENHPAEKWRRTNQSKPAYPDHGFIGGEDNW